MKKSKTRIRAKSPVDSSQATEAEEVLHDQDVHFAALEGDTTRLEKLLDADGTLVNAVGNDGWTPLHFASNAGELLCCLLLLERGADVGCTTRSSGDTALHLLVTHSFDDVPLFMSVISGMSLQGGITRRNRDGLTPIDMARARGRLSTESLLRTLSSPAPLDPLSENTTDMSALTALSEGTESGRESERESEEDLVPPTVPAPPPPSACDRESAAMSFVSKAPRIRSKSLMLGEDAVPVPKKRKHRRRKRSPLVGSPSQVRRKRASTMCVGSDGEVGRGGNSSSSYVSDGNSSSSEPFMSESSASDARSSSTSGLAGHSDISCGGRSVRGAEEEQGTGAGNKPTSTDPASFLVSPRWSSPKVSRVSSRPEYTDPKEIIERILTAKEEPSTCAGARDFLLFYRLSLSCTEVMALVLDFFELTDDADEEMAPPVTDGEELLNRRTRIVELLSLIVSEYAPDFAYCHDAHQLLRAFFRRADAAIASQRGDAGGTFLDFFPMAEHLEFKTLVESAIEQGTRWVHLAENMRLDGAGTPSLVLAPPIDMLTVDCDHLANQLTVMAQELYSNTSPLLLLHYHHCEADDDPFIDTTCAAVRNIYSQYAQLRQWVVTAVVTVSDVSVRAELVERLIRIAMRCEVLSNFFTTEALLQALHSPIVARLTQTWAALSRKVSVQFTEFLSTYGRRNNVKEYVRMSEEGRAFVPNLEILKREIAAASQKQAFDVSRQQRLVRVLNGLGSVSYDFAPDEEIQHALYHLPVLPDTIATHFSNSLQSPATGQSVVIPLDRGNLCCSVSRGVFKVVSGTVDGLIDHLLDSDFIAVSSEFVDTFLLTQSYFISSHELLAKILTKGDMLHSGAASSLKGKELDAFLKQQARRRTRMMEILRRWMELSFSELRNDPKVVSTLGLFCRQAEMASPDETFFFVHTLSMAFGKQPRMRKRTRSVLDDTVQGFSLAENTFSREKMLDDSFPKEAAKQMCLIDQKLLHSITARELLRRGDEAPAASSANGSDGQHYDHLAQWSTRFNLVSQWVALCVVSQSDLAGRISMLRQVVRLAWECMSLNNFNSSYAIVAGLNSSSVSRLKSAWDGLSTSLRGKFAKLETLFDFRANHKNYRTQLRMTQPPIIPFLGIYTKDIFALQENNSDRLENGHINFEKFSMLVRIIRDVLQYQEHSYSFDPNIPLLHFLRDIEGMDEEKMYEASLRREAQSSPIVVHNPLFGKEAQLRRARTPQNERRGASPLDASRSNMFDKKVYVNPSAIAKDRRPLFRRTFSISRSLSKRVGRDGREREEKVTTYTNPLKDVKSRTPRS